MKRAYCLALCVMACGGNETPETSESESTESASESETETSEARTGSTGETEAEAPRPNRSAGPARAGFSIVPQRMHRQYVEALRVFGRHAAAGTGRGMVTVFDVPSGHVRAARRLFFGAVTEVALSNDRKRLFATGASGGEDSEPTEGRVWDLDTDRVWQMPEEYSVHRAMSPDGSRVATLVEDDELEVRLYDVWSDRPRKRSIESDHNPRDVFFAHDSRSLYVVTNVDVQRLGLPGLRPRGEPWLHLSGRQGQIARHPSEDQIAVSQNAKVFIRALSDGESKHELDAGRNVEALRWSEDGKRVVACGRGGARVFEGENFDTVIDLPMPGLRCYQAQFDLVSETPALMVTRDHKLTYITPDGEQTQLEPQISGPTAFPTRTGWFLYGVDTDVYIANLTRQRSRRLVRGGNGELSAWSTVVTDRGIELRVRDSSFLFGSDEEPETEPSEATAEPTTPARPDFKDIDEPFRNLGDSPDHMHRVVVTNPEEDPEVFLQSSGADALIPLRQTGDGLGIECWIEYDEYGDDGETEEYYYCGDAQAVFAPDNSSVIVSGSEASASYDLTGRRLGVSSQALRAVRFLPDGKILVSRANNAVEIIGSNLRRVGTVLRARERMTPYNSISEDRSTVVSLRGAALTIFDVASNARKHLITLPARGNDRAIFEDGGLIQVRVESAFVWYRLEDGEEVRRVEMDGVLAINEDRTKALTCTEDRLRHVDTSNPENGMDLGPCPTDARRMGFDNQRVWWVEGSRAHVVRLSDAEHLILGAYQLRTPLLYAFTPRGHMWVDRPSALSSVRARVAGPILDAEHSVPEASWVRETLIEDFLTDRDLGDAPER